MHKGLRISLLLFILMIACSCSAGGLSFTAQATPTSSPPYYPIEETGIQYCYNFLGAFPCPDEAGILYGQDANYLGASFNFSDNANGTINDAVSGLTWQQIQSNSRASQADAQQACQDLNLAGKDDWRLPSIQELFSLATMSGSPGTAFFINSNLFEIRYAEPDEEYVDGLPFDLSGQTWSTTLSADGQTAYSYNFFNGELRAYPVEQTFFYRCVSGNTYGQNDFTDHGDGTVNDLSSGLTWQQTDSVYALNWGGALNYCENLTLGGVEDWRLPDIKELFSLAFSVQDATLFPASSVGERLWSSTTRVDAPSEAYYLCSGDCLTLDKTTDLGSESIHSEPKNGDPQEYSGSAIEVRINNFARCVRGGTVSKVTGPYLVADATPELVPDVAAAAQELGIDQTVLSNALGNLPATDPLIQKAAFALGVDLDSLRSALQAHMVEPTQTPST